MKSFRLDRIPQSSAALLLGRVLNPDGTPLHPSLVSSITLAVYDYRDMEETVATATLTLADVLLPSLQTDSRWKQDGTGYNFVHQVTPAQVPKRGKVYRFQFTFTLTDGTVIRSTLEVPTDAVYGIDED